MNKEERSEEPLFSRKKIYTPEERRQYVQAWSETNDSLEKFCRDHELEPSTFLLWAKRCKVKEENPFRPLGISEVRPSSDPPIKSHFDEKLLVAITLPNKIKIEITPIASIATFQQLLKAISSWN